MIMSFKFKEYVHSRILIVLRNGFDNWHCTGNFIAQVHQRPKHCNV